MFNASDDASQTDRKSSRSAVYCNGAHSMMSAREAQNTNVET